MACRISDPGCTTALQLSNSGGKLESRIPNWRAWVRPVRWTSVLIFAFVVGGALDGTSGQSGLFERLYAAAAAAVAALAVGILRRARH